MNAPQKIETMTHLVVGAFASQTRIGPIPIPASTHSLRVGLSLLSYGYEIDLCLGGFGHDLLEDTEVTDRAIEKLFGERVAYLVRMCSIDPALGDTEEGERELFLRVYNLACKGDVGPIIIKCADSMDNLRTNAYLKPKWQVGLYEWGVIWHRHLCNFFRNAPIAEDFKSVLVRESKRLALPL